MNETWTVPGNERYWVSWENVAAEPANITYTFRADPPPPTNPLWYVLPVVAVGGTVAAFWHARRRRVPKEPRAAR